MSSRSSGRGQNQESPVALGSAPECLSTIQGLGVPSLPTCAAAHPASHLSHPQSTTASGGGPITWRKTRKKKSQLKKVHSSSSVQLIISSRVLSRLSHQSILPVIYFIPHKSGYLPILGLWAREGTGDPLQYFAWKIPWTEEPGGLQSMGPRRVGHDWVTSLSLFTFMHWRRKWQPTPVFLPGESQGWRSLVGCHLWGHTESDTTEVA